MRVSGINLYGVYGYDPNSNHKRKFGNTISLDKYKNVENLNFMPGYYPVCFTSSQNQGKLRILFHYKLPCIYSGKIMVDPKEFSALLKSGIFNKPSKESLEVFSRYRSSITGVEERLLSLLIARSKIHPDKNLHELLAEIEPVYRRDLRKKQSHIFRELKTHIGELPKEYQEKYKTLIVETDKRLDERPVLIPFSSNEFKYKLAKIRDEIMSTYPDLKTKKLLKKLMKESKLMPSSTNPSAEKKQKEVLDMMDKILKKSVLKDNKDLQELISTSQARLSKKEIIAPFSRKSFLYDLGRIVDDLPKEQREKIMQIACKLPTSSQDFSAYIVKISQESSDKIASRIIWPSLASIEHIHPKSEGGANELFNFAGATTRENAMRKSIDFIEQMKRRPNTPYYCQMYVNRLIELYKQGIFKKHNISPKYIEDFKKTIYTESKGQIDLDISEYYKSQAISVTSSTII